MRFLVAQQEVLVAGADLSGLTMEISGPGSIVGSIQTDNGVPLPADLVIFVELVSKTSRPGPPMPVRVRPDGSFIMDGVQSGETFIAIALPPGVNSFIKSVTANGDDLYRSPLKVTERAEAGPVQVVISRAVGSLTGRLLAENGGQGISDFVILLLPVEPEKQRFRTTYLTTRPGADGSFSLTGAPGEYLVLAKRREDLPAIVSEEFVRTQAANAVRVTLVSGEQKHLDLHPN
ncbi:MAG: hypothetical protein M3539_17615 [Acidobacteriota bacterium]|nr:hypothetical protein [Acidobacteriota bacterium]